MSYTEKGRLSALRKDDVFSLVIFPERNKTKLYLLFTWLVLWTACGLIFISYYINFSKGPEYAKIEFEKIQNEIKEIKEKEKAIEQLKLKLEKNQTQRMILLVVIGFWLYYEFKIGRAFLFRKYGFEKIWIKNGFLFYRREFSSRGKTKQFDLNFIKEIKQVEYNETDFFQNMNRSFWSLNGESVEFSYHSKVMRFGIQLNDQESKTVVKELKKEIKIMYI